MERFLSLSQVKAHSLFYVTQFLQEPQYFDDALKRNCQFVKVLQVLSIQTIPMQRSCNLILLSNFLL